MIDWLIILCVVIILLSLSPYILCLYHYYYSYFIKILFDVLRFTMCYVNE